MPRSNSSGPSKGRRTSTSARPGSGRSASNKSSDKPFKKSAPGKSFGKRPTTGGGYKKEGDKKPFSSSSFSEKPANKFSKSSERNSSFGKTERPGATPKSEKAFKRFDPKYDTRKPDYNSPEAFDPKKRSASSTGFGKKDSRTPTGQAPFKKFDSRKPAFDKDKPAYPKKRTGDSSSFRKDDRTSSSPAAPRRVYKKREENAEGKSGFFRKEKVYSPDSRKKGRTTEEEQVPTGDGKIRLNRFIANSGVCSRREADQLITLGVISVNGKTITELGYKVNRQDEVRHDNKVLTAEKPVYILMNKPKGFLTTTNDPQERNTVMHIIGNSVKERVYPVGRLDRNTTGLLLLTNDGDLADKLMHPSYKAKKIYKVELDRPLTKADYQTILEGVKMEEGRAMVDDLAIISEDKRTVGIELHIGWNRVVRRIFESLNYEVVKLDRSVYAGLDKKELSRGQWRFLRRDEIIMLKNYTT